MAEDQLTGTRSEWTLERRREFMNLPVDERRRQLAEQAAGIVDYYSLPEESALREVWQGGEIVDSDSCPADQTR